MAVGGWTGFLPGLALPGLGSAAAPWAVVTRICGGFATVLSTIVAPPLEARLSRAIRGRDREAFASARRTALLSGAGLAGVAVVTGLALGVYTTGFRAAEEWFLPLLLATALFWGSTLVSLSVSPLPNFLGRDGVRLAWDAGRAVLMTAAWLTTDGVTRLIVMGVVLAVSTVCLVPLTRYRGRDTAVAAEPAPEGKPFVEAIR
jgi:cytochrome c biogenesis protein CcdA